MDLFETSQQPQSFASQPLAARMRPTTLDEFAEGNPDLLGARQPLRKWIESDRLPSLILWGPAGSGKTSLAHVIAERTSHHFVPLSAVMAGVKDIKAAVEAAKRLRASSGRRTLLFIDEIHRFNRTQQDALLPHVEDGTFILLGATTENPSFSLNAAILSRARVIRLQRHSEEALGRLLDRALRDPGRGLGGVLVLAEDARAWIARVSDGDARKALSTLETLLPHAAGPKALTQTDVQSILLAAGVESRTLPYDRAGDSHHDCISALIKSMRASQPDAATYYLARMLSAGEDPLFIARRLVIFAAEDVGVADPRALTVALGAKEAVHFVGMPEGRISLAQAVIYLAVAPKSRACYEAINAAMEEVAHSGTQPIPFDLRNKVHPSERAAASSAASAESAWLPSGLSRTRFYQPGSTGLERLLSSRRSDDAPKPASPSRASPPGVSAGGSPGDP